MAAAKNVLSEVRRLGAVLSLYTDLQALSFVPLPPPPPILVLLFLLSLPDMVKSLFPFSYCYYCLSPLFFSFYIIAFLITPLNKSFPKPSLFSSPTSYLQSPFSRFVPLTSPSLLVSIPFSFADRDLFLFSFFLFSFSPFFHSYVMNCNNYFHSSIIKSLLFLQKKRITQKKNSACDETQAS